MDLLIVAVLVVAVASSAFFFLQTLRLRRELEEERRKRLLTERIGQALHRYVKNDLVSGKTGFSFTGNRAGIRSFEVWRNENLNKAANLVRIWEERHAYDQIPVRELGLPSPTPLDPRSMDEVSRKVMEQPVVPDLRELDQEEFDPREQQ